MITDYDFASMVKKVNVVNVSEMSRWEMGEEIRQKQQEEAAATAKRRASYMGKGGGINDPNGKPGDIVTVCEDRPRSVSWISEDTDLTVENLLSALEVTEEERRHIWGIDQREADWHRHRAGRLTGSKIGAAAGHNNYTSPEKLLKEWLYTSVPDNANMRWGRDHEDAARETYRTLRIAQFANGKSPIEFEPVPDYIDEEFRFIDNVVPVDPNEVSDLPYDNTIEVRGLIVNTEYPWLAYSPDGEITETDDRGLLEIKCPSKFTTEIYHSYYDQIHLGMATLGLKWCDFFVWTPYNVSLKRYAFNENYWKNCLLPKARAFYMDKFLPAAIEAIAKERAWTPETAKRQKILRL